MHMTAMQYFDKVMARLRGLGLVPDETEEAPGRGFLVPSKVTEIGSVVLNNRPRVQTGHMVCT